MFGTQGSRWHAGAGSCGVGRGEDELGIVQVVNWVKLSVEASVSDCEGELHERERGEVWRPFLALAAFSRKETRDSDRKGLTCHDGICVGAKAFLPVCVKPFVEWPSPQGMACSLIRAGVQLQHPRCVSTTFSPITRRAIIQVHKALRDFLPLRRRWWDLPRRS
jgi:hypothetical protein